jgi:hypothetical protein
LRIGALLLGGDAGVADQAAGDGGFPGFGRHGWEYPAGFRGICTNVEGRCKRSFAQVADVEPQQAAATRPPARGRGGGQPGRRRLEILG